MRWPSISAPSMAPAAPPDARARRVFSARWVGDDASFADRGGVTSPPFPELTLRDGDPLDSPLFPGLAAGVSHWRRDLL